jgi:hypothetical protein
MQQKSVGSEKTSVKKQALDLFTQQYASNLDVSATLGIKRKLFGKSSDDDHNASLFLLLSHDERMLFLDDIILTP